MSYNPKEKMPLPRHTFSAHHPVNASPFPNELSADVSVALRRLRDHDVIAAPEVKNLRAAGHDFHVMGARRVYSGDGVYVPRPADLFSHDIRQALQAITLLVETLRERVPGGQQADIVDQITASVECAELIIDKFRQASESDPEPATTYSRVFRVDRLLADIGAEFTADAQARGLSMEFRLRPCSTSSDPSLVADLLKVLVANAIKHTPRGFVRLTCVRKRGAINVSVADSGVGIAKAARVLIAEEFYQPHDPSPDGHHPLGKGLAVVARIARLLGHTVSVTSRVGRGSTFTISMPVVDLPLCERSISRLGDDHH
jgi:K+-sensing histidine kinase KdpD